MVGRIAKSWGRGLLLGCGVQVVALGWLAVVAVAWGLAFPHLPRDVRTFVAPLALVTWMGTLTPAGIAVLAFVVVRRNARLDRAFASLGPGRALAPVARAWAGERDGRAVNAWFSKGPQLELYVAATPRTSVGIGPSGALQALAGRAFDREPIPLDDTHVAMGVDPTWIRHLVKDPEARAALLGLLADDGATVTIAPDSVKLTLRLFELDRLDRAEVDRLLGLLVRLARAADALPPTADPVAPGGLGSGLRTYRGTLVGLLVIVLGCGGALAVLLPIVIIGMVLAVQG